MVVQRFTLSVSSRERILGSHLCGTLKRWRTPSASWRPKWPKRTTAAKSYQRPVDSVTESPIRIVITTLPAVKLVTKVSAWSVAKGPACRSGQAGALSSILRPCVFSIVHLSFYIPWSFFLFSSLLVLMQTEWPINVISYPSSYFVHTSFFLKRRSYFIKLTGWQDFSTNPRGT